MEGPRGARIDEFEELMNLLGQAYGYPERGWFPSHYPHLYRQDPESLKNNLIIKDEGRIVAHVGLFPLQLTVGGEVIKVGGIGGVATHPDFRGRGHMKKILGLAISRMAAGDYAFSILWGDRQRYGNFGWELGGRNLVVNLTPRSLLWKGIKPLKGEGYNGHSEETEKIMALHEREALRAERSGKDYSLLMQRAGTETWIGNSSYLVLSEGQGIRPVIESGGDPREFLSLCLWLIQDLKLEMLRVWRPYQDSRTTRALIEASAGWYIEPLGLIKLINLDKILERFREQISQEERAAISFLTDPERETVKLLFGFTPDKERGMDLPLRFYLWGLDRV